MTICRDDLLGAAHRLKATGDLRTDKPRCLNGEPAGFLAEGLHRCEVGLDEVDAVFSQRDGGSISSPPGPARPTRRSSRLIAGVDLHPHDPAAQSLTADGHARALHDVIEARRKPAPAFN